MLKNFREINSLVTSVLVKTSIRRVNVDISVKIADISHKFHPFHVIFLYVLLTTRSQLEPAFGYYPHLKLPKTLQPAGRKRDFTVYIQGVPFEKLQK